MSEKKARIEEKEPIVLAYWAIRGLGAPIRLLLEYTKTPYEFVKYEIGEAPEYNRDSWFKVKYTLGLDFPNLPYMKHGDFSITESGAIMRYIARLTNTAGTDAKHEATVEMLAGVAGDIRSGITRIAYNKDYEKLKVDFFQKYLPDKLKSLNAYLDGKKFFSGNEPTYVDFIYWEIFDQLRIMSPGCLDEYENVVAFKKTVENLPAIAAFLKSDRWYERPINNKNAAFH